MSKIKTRWYRNMEGFPKISLRETFSVNNISDYKNEIIELFSIEKDIKKFYNICKFLPPTGGLSNLVNTIYSNNVLESINEKFTVVIKERQIGFSMTSAVIALYFSQILNKSVSIVTSGNLMDKIKMIYMYLPEHIKLGVNKLTKKEIRFNNGCRIIVTKNFSFGWSPNLTICDEFDWLSNKQRSTVENIIPVISARLNDQLIIGSTIKGDSLEKSIIGLLTNSSYTIHSFKLLNMGKLNPIITQFIRDRKINNILDGI